MGVLSSFRQLDENSVKLWNDLPEEKMEEMEELGTKLQSFGSKRGSLLSGCGLSEFPVA
ncbi:unnamed protein product [Prunus armeniaca]